VGVEGYRKSRWEGGGVEGDVLSCCGVGEGDEGGRIEWPGRHNGLIS
jgi:hypothetical protein